MEDLIDRKITVNIMEIKAPDRDANLVAESIAEQLKKRAGFRRVLKQRAESAMATGVLGVKIMVSGRLGGQNGPQGKTDPRVDSAAHAAGAWTMAMPSAARHTARSA
ncbi:MAG: hypothetical protein R3E58_06605 [Phycisphaerae bacterium]